jgi:hypothetical protein
MNTAEANTATSARRRHRAAVARRVAGHEAAAALEWDALDRAPGWLALPDPEFATFQRRVGAVLQGRALRLWIDGPRIAAARAALGAPFLAKLLAQPDSVSIPVGLVSVPPIDRAEQVAPMLHAAGAAVLLASLPHGPLRRAAAEALAPATASPMAHELAAALVERARMLGAAA